MDIEKDMKEGEATVDKMELAKKPGRLFARRDVDLFSYIKAGGATLRGGK